MPSYPYDPLELALCRKDRKWRFEKHLAIKPPTGPPVAMGKMRRGQLKLFNLIAHLRAQNKPVRIIVLKDRKVGVSTLEAADLFCEVLDNEQEAAIIAHDLDGSEYLFEMVKRFYDFYDLPKPRLAKLNEKELKFQQHAGRIQVLTSGSKAAIRGRTPQFVLCSEVSRWKDAIEVDLALVNAVPKLPGTTIIYETTACGYDPLFQPAWDNASHHCTVTFDDQLKPTIAVNDPDGKWNGLVPIFLSVVDNEEKRAAFDSEEERTAFLATLDEHETFLLHELRALPEYLKWRRGSIAQEHKGNLALFNQENPETPLQAFIASGKPRFDLEALARMSIEKPLLGRLQRADARRDWATSATFVPDTGGTLRLYRRPNPTHRYAMGVDMATGLTSQAGNRDASVITIVDCETGDECAVIRGQLASEAVKQQVCLLGEWYNDAFIVPETAFADLLIAWLEENYPRRQLYTAPNRRTGYHTHVGSRGPLIDNLADQIANGFLKLHDADSVAECRTFIYSDKGRIEAASGSHDDHVMSLGLAIVGVSRHPGHLRPPQVQHQGPMHLYAPVPSSGGGWDGYGGGDEL